VTSFDFSTHQADDSRTQRESEDIIILRRLVPRVLPQLMQEAVFELNACAARASVSDVAATAGTSTNARIDAAVGAVVAVIRLAASLVAGAHTLELVDVLAQQMDEAFLSACVLVLCV